MGIVVNAAGSALGQYTVRNETDLATCINLDYSICAIPANTNVSLSATLTTNRAASITIVGADYSSIIDLGGHGTAKSCVG